MPGLLDFLGSDEAKLGMGLLGAGGPSATPLSFGQRMQGAMQGFEADKDAALRRRYVESQITNHMSEAELRNMQVRRDNKINDLVAKRLGSPQAGMGDPGGMAPMPGDTSGGMAPTPYGAPPQGLLAQPPSFGQPGGSGVVAQGAPMAPAGMPPQQGPSGGMAPGAAPAGGAFPFDLGDLVALQASGFKGASDLFQMYRYANDGVKRESGAYYVDPMTGQQRYFPKLGEGQVMGPNGMVSNAPGYAQANAGSKGMEAGAVEAAKLPYAVATDRARQTTSAALDTQPVVGADGNTYYEPRLAIATGGGRGGQAGMVPGGAQGGVAGGALASGGFMAARNPITQQSQIAINDNWLKNTYQPTIDAGKVATDLDNSIQALRMVDVKTGWGTEAKASAASFLAGLGVSAGNAGMYAANAQKFQSIAMDKLMTTLQAQKGPQTEGDADRAKQTFVSLRNTPEANAFIMDFAQAKANADRRRAQYYEQALPLAQKQGDLTRINREWGKVQGSLWSDPLLHKWAK